MGIGGFSEKGKYVLCLCLFQHHAFADASCLCSRIGMYVVICATCQLVSLDEGILLQVDFLQKAICYRQIAEPSIWHMLSLIMICTVITIAITHVIK